MVASSAELLAAATLLDLIMLALSSCTCTSLHLPQYTRTHARCLRYTYSLHFNFSMEGGARGGGRGARRRAAARRGSSRARGRENGRWRAGPAPWARAWAVGGAERAARARRPRGEKILRCTRGRAFASHKKSGVALAHWRLLAAQRASERMGWASGEDSGNMSGWHRLPANAGLVHNVAHTERHGTATPRAASRYSRHSGHAGWRTRQRASSESSTHSGAGAVLIQGNPRRALMLARQTPADGHRIMHAPPSY